MANTPDRQLGVLLSNSEGDIFTASQDLLITQMVLSNIDTSSHTIRLYHTSGGAGTNAGIIMPDVPLDGNAMITFGGLYLKSGDKIRGYADSANKIAATTYYTKQS